MTKVQPPTAATVPPTPTDQRPSTTPELRPFFFETVKLDPDTPLVLRATRKRVHVGWDPRQATHELAVELFHLCAADAGVNTTGVDFPTLRQIEAAAEMTRIILESSDPAGAARQTLDLIEAEKEQAAYVPPTDWDQAEAITCAGERGAILKACLFTPMWNGIPERPTRLCIYSDPDSEGELDLAGADKLIADLEALMPKLRAMRVVLAAAERVATDPR